MIKAIFFDFDGTLVDSEAHTPAAIRQVMEELGHPGVELPPEKTQGRPWMEIVHELSLRFGPLDSEGNQVFTKRLHATWISMVRHAVPLPGAQEAVRDASAHFRLAVVSSSRTPYLDEHLERLGMGAYIEPHLRIGADKISRFKPDPEGYLLAASLCEARPSECLVFEDSSAGLKAARAAGMHCIAVTGCSAEREAGVRLADAACRDFREFSRSSWAALAGQPQPSLKAILQPA